MERYISVKEHLSKNQYTWLITGAAGFIGSNLVNFLIAKKKIKTKIICIDNLSTGHIKNLKKHKDKIIFKKIDIKKKFNIKCDQIYHLACPASPTKYQIDELDTLDTINYGTRNVLNNAKKFNSKVLIASTSEIYGEPLIHPQSEKYYGNVNTIGPRSCYDEGKRMTETLSYIYRKKYNLKINIARIFNTYGPRMDPEDGRVVSTLINQFLRHNNLTINGNGMQTRSFCYIDDQIEGLYKFMNSKINFDVINIGNPQEISLMELIKVLQKKFNFMPKITFKKMQLNDPKQRKPNIDKAIKRLNWRPRVDLEEGLDKTIEYFKKLDNHK